MSKDKSRQFALGANKIYGTQTHPEGGIKGAPGNWEWPKVYNLKTATRASCSLPGCKATSLERLMLKLKLKLFPPPDMKSRLTGKDPDTGKD